MVLMELSLKLYKGFSCGEEAVEFAKDFVKLYDERGFKISKVLFKPGVVLIKGYYESEL